MWPRRKRSMFGWGSLDVGKDEHFAEVLDDQSVIACSFAPPPTTSPRSQGQAA